MSFPAKEVYAGTTTCLVSAQGTLHRLVFYPDAFFLIFFVPIVKLSSAAIRHLSLDLSEHVEEIYCKDTCTWVALTYRSRLSCSTHHRRGRTGVLSMEA